MWNKTPNYSKNKNELGKLKYLGAMVLDKLLAGFCKADNPGAAFNLFDTHWLYPNEQT